MIAQRTLAWAAAAVALASCSVLTDPATRLAGDLEQASEQLPREEGARLTVVHETPSAAGQCDGPYRVQLDEVGALFVWCMDAQGKTVSSSSTTYHHRFVDTRATIIVDKAAGAPLRIDLVREGKRATIVGAA